MENKLHLKIVQNIGDTYKFDSSFGGLYLPKASAFSVTIKEYEEDKKKMADHYTKSKDEAGEKWKKRSAEGWAIEKLRENWDANNKQIEKAYSEAKIALKERYKDVNWVWIVAPKKPIPSEFYHNNELKKGIPEDGKVEIDFPKILEGGGMAYLEAYHEGDTPMGKKPFGLFVQAGGEAGIVRIEWTDFDYNPLKGKTVAFGSEVLLHVYTAGMYGQEVEILLSDKDYISKDDHLITFEREVNIHKVHPKEKGKLGVSHKLAKAEKNGEGDPNQFIQKLVIEVKIDYSWISKGGMELKVYPAVKSKKNNELLYIREIDYLEVAMSGGKHNAPKEITNSPVLVGQVETNIAAYHPCQYTGIDYTDDKGESTNIYTEREGVSEPNHLEVAIIAGEDPKKFKL